MTGVQVIAIYVSDVERAKDFYVDTLGLELNGPSGGGYSLKSGNMSFYLEGGRTQQVESGLTYNTISPALATKSIKNAYETLKAKGVQIVEDFVQYGEAFAMFRIADPDGNVLKFAGEP